MTLKGVMIADGELSVQLLSLYFKTLNICQS